MKSQICDRDVAPGFLRTMFEADDWVAVFLKTYDTGRDCQRVTPIAMFSEPRWQTWLQVMNAHRFNVYVSVNAMTPGRYERTKGAVRAVRHVFLDADDDGPAVLRSLEARHDLPRPSYVIYSSPGRIHVLWRVRGFSPERVERIKVESELPWNGKVKIHVKPETQKDFTLHVRKPSCTTASPEESTAAGYDPRVAVDEAVTRVWSADGKTLEFNFDMSIQLRRTHPKVQGHAGKVTVTRGPLVYCLESVDNPGVDIFTVQIDPSSLREEFVPDLLGGCVVIQGELLMASR